MSTPTTPIDDVAQHYTPTKAALDAVMTALSKEKTILTLADLAGADQFHSGGIEATRMLAQRAGITSKDRVLDVGGAFGGPARILATEIGCQVTVIDLTEGYCRLGEKLTERTGLTERVHFQQGNALDLPFEAGSFDVVWTQHSSMNIANKELLYTQFHRVLRTGGRLALHEVMVGSGEPLRFPVPWAPTEATSFLLTPNMFRDTVTKAGFCEVEWIEFTEWTVGWFQAAQSTPQNTSGIASEIGLGRLFGPGAGVMVRNFATNAQEDRIRLSQGVFERI